MAIAYDNSTSGGANVSSFSHTCTGSNLLLVVFVEYVGGTGPTVTYNGVSMTNAYTDAWTSGYTLKTFYLFAPNTGSNTVSITTNGAAVYGAVAASYTGVNQSGFPDATGTWNGGNGTTSGNATVTVVASNCWIIAGASVASGSGAGGVSTNLSSSRVTSGYDGSTQRLLNLSDTNATVTTGNNTVTTTVSGGGAFYGNCRAFSIAPATVASSNSNFLMFMPN